MEQMNNDTSKFFSGEVVYPRQFEVHLPGNHLQPCDLHCSHCAGKLFQKDLGTWEMTALELLRKLGNGSPYHVYGGAYCEPLTNPYYLTFLHTTKTVGSHFGIHTNGALLLRLEEQVGWLTELNRFSTDRLDYLSVALDAGLPQSWAKTKGIHNEDLFFGIIEALGKAVKIRKDAAGKGHSIRLCYLITPHSASQEDFDNVVSIAKNIGVDTLRFSIPFASYNQPFDKVREYKQARETPMKDVYAKMLELHLSVSMDEKPYIFYSGPEFTDIDNYDFKQCAYCYFNMTYGADGYVYKCSTTSTPTMKTNRLGKITDDLEEFRRMVKMNQNPNWDTNNCFSRGARCNRMGIEINRTYAKLKG